MYDQRIDDGVMDDRDSGAPLEARSPHAGVPGGVEAPAHDATAPDAAEPGGTAEAPPAPRFIYAIGRVEARFPRLSTEKEFAQATGRAQTDGLSDRQAFHALLSKRENRYLVRQLCWVFTIEGIDTYVLVPGNPVDFDLLVESVRPTPRATDVDVVIGHQGPLAPPDLCNGLAVPLVAFDQLYSFDVDSLVKSIPKPDKPDVKIAAAQFERIAEELFERIMQMADNAGATDEHRALNYVAVRYPTIYATAAEAVGRNQSLQSVGVRPSRLSGARRLVDVVFTYAHRETGVSDRSFVRVDVTEEFPFLASRISPYYVYDQYP